MKKTIAFLLMLLVLVMFLSTVTSAQQVDRVQNRDLPAAIVAQKLESPLVLEDANLSTLHPTLLDSEGRQRVIVRLATDSVAESGLITPEAQSSQARAVEEAQDRFIDRARQFDQNLRTLGDVQVVLNAVFMEVEAAALPALAADPEVERIVPVGNYEMDLSETVPYIGASAVQATGVDGSGIKVAVLDSGVDYYHADLGGSGDPADYAADDPTIIEPRTFPTDKVVGGFDFVGSAWFGTGGPAEDPDPDPIDDGPGAGHGTHVADIIGGVHGVAPGVDIYAVKVCSSISTSCSGIALIQGMEFAADPNGDGRSNDRVDIINMSLGSNYGQPFDDDLSQAVENATDLGILTVSSAGNGADKPYVTGTPSSAPSALSVAETNVPSAALQLINVDGADYPAVFQLWSVPLSGSITGPVQYGDGAGGNLNGCAPFAPGSLTGLIVLVDRGVCNFTLKISHISQAGGSAGIIGLIAPGAPFVGGDGGDRPIDIPGYMISQADSNAIKAQIGNPGIGTIDENNQLPLVGSMVGGSSRGPQHESTQLIKPEIGAPGASVSAIAGSGTDTGPFGGTSGASPMVAGSAALLLEGFDTDGDRRGLGPRPSPLEVKSLLMNTANTDIATDPFTGLAPITRIGGGEVRVDAAIGSPVAAWDADVPQGGLSFGYVDVAGDTVSLTKTVQVHNYAGGSPTYNISTTFRFMDDVANGAVTISAPSSVTFDPRVNRDNAFFDVTLTIDGSLLRPNSMNSGSQGADPAPLTEQEYDGYIILDNGEHTIHLPWHVLPRKAAEVEPERTTIVPGGFPDVIGLNNVGVGTAQNDAYALLATSPEIPGGGPGAQSPTPDIRAVGINTFPVPAGFCSAADSFVWAFAVNTWERQEHLLPVSHQVSLDTNQDGTVDYVVLNRDFSGLATITDGRQLSWAVNLATGSASAFFFAEHSTNTGNTVLFICAEQVGLSGADLLTTNVDMSVFAQDFYYGGPGDTVSGLTVTPLGEQFFGQANDVPGNTNDPVGLSIFDFGPFPGNTPELGLLLFTNGDRGTGFRGGATQGTEALLFTLP